MASPAIPNVAITIVDGGANAALSVPLASIQLNIGCCVSAASAATPTVIASMSPQTLQSTLIGGPLLEKAGLVAANGGVALCITCPVSTRGTATAVTAGTNVGNSTVTVTTDSVVGAWDDYNVKVVCSTAGTLGTAPGPSIQISLDAGRNYGAPISLGTSLTYGIGGTLNAKTAGGTGLQLGFTTAQTMSVGDSWVFSTTAPLWSDSGVQAAYNAYLASQYAVAGVGSTHIIGTASASDITNFQSYLNAGVAGYIFPRALVELRDALTPVAWGGSGETEAAWISSLATAMSGETAQSRICAGGGRYNTPSPFPGVGGGTFSYRRPGTWSQAVRRTQIGLAQRAGEVDLGSYSTIAVNPATDPNDGFVYHDERVTQGLNVARIASLMTYPKQGAGFYQCQEPLLSPNTSQFTEVVLGNVIDAASDIAYAVGIQILSSQLVTTPAGVLESVFRNTFQAKIQRALQLGLVAGGLATSVLVVVSATANVLATSNVPVTVTVTPFGYANSISFTLNLNTAGI